MTVAAKNPSIDALQSENESLKKELLYLKEQLEWLKRQIFGQKSEKLVNTHNDKQLMFEGFEDIKATFIDEGTKVDGHIRKKPNRDGKDKLSFPDDLPKETTVIDIQEDEKICKESGKALVKIGEEVTQKLAHRPGSFYIKEIIRPKYAVPGNSDQGICIAQLPDSIIPKCKADESFLADILVRKFADHLPLYRISEGLSRCGILVSRKLLSQWVVRLGEELKPLYDQMHQNILESGNVFIDESPVKMLAPGKGKTHQGYMWVVVGGNDPPTNVVYRYRENRKHHNASDLLGSFSGNMHSDKYGAYEELAKRKEINWCPCMSHIRRKFFEAESGDLEFREWILGKINALFMLERTAWEATAEERLRIRKEQEEPIMDEMIRAVKKKVHEGKALPKSKFREALFYVFSLIPHLKNYMNHPYARLDNNVAERSVRPLAIGRKNWLFVGSPKAGESAAVILSLVQTCRNLEINPREYLEDVFRRFQGHPMNKLYELLPKEWAKNRK